MLVKTISVSFIQVSRKWNNWNDKYRGSQNRMINNLALSWNASILRCLPCLVALQAPEDNGGEMNFMSASFSGIVIASLLPLYSKSNGTVGELMFYDNHTEIDHVVLAI